jgi:hypothetical protein
MRLIPVLTHAVIAASTVLFLTAPAVSQSPTARIWTDATGKYQWEADLIGASEDMLVLQRTNRKKDLVAVPLDKLSDADREYLRSKGAEEMMQRSSEAQQTWTMRSGLKVIGNVVDFGRRDVTIQRQRGKVYVNDRLLENLPDLQQKMLVKLVAHLENEPLESERDLKEWIAKLKGAPLTYTVEGVILELENGDRYGVPFFFFSPEDLELLEPGWQRWLAAHDRSEQQAEASQDARPHPQQEIAQEEFMLQMAAQAYQRDRQINQQIQQMELGLLATAAGVTDLWEVQLFPPAGVPAYPKIVVVPGNNSGEAQRTAMQRFPGYTAGAAARANRTR